MLTTSSNASLHTASGKNHYEALDGLRGVAAISVVIYHFLAATGIKSYNIISHAYLAVDFFFCLSGFVIGYAYDDRLKNLGILTFFKNRLIRLHPMVMLGSVLGLISFLFDPFNTNGIAAGTTRIIITFFCSLLLIPLPKFPDRPDWLFPFNGVLWSLFMEYIANVFYALVLFRINRRILAMFAIIAALLLSYVSWHRGTLGLGWAYYNLLPGFTRIAYSFSAGLLIYRYSFILRFERLGFATLCLSLILIFMLPNFSGLNWLLEAVIVIFIFPIIVSLGVNLRVSGLIRKLSIFLGEISYPLYLIHFVIVWPFGLYCLNAIKKPEGLELFLIIIGLTVLLTIFSYLILKFYDEPVRVWLKKVSTVEKKAG